MKDGNKIFALKRPSSETTHHPPEDYIAVVRREGHCDLL